MPTHQMPIIVRPWGYYSIPDVNPWLPEIPDLAGDKDKSTGNYNILWQILLWEPSPGGVLNKPPYGLVFATQQIALWSFTHVESAIHVENAKSFHLLAKTNLQGKIAVLITHSTANHQIYLDFLLLRMVCSSTLFQYRWYEIARTPKALKISFELLKIKWKSI